MKRVFSITLSVLLIFGCLAGCASDGDGGSSGGKGTISFANAGWDSIMFHNAVAGFIATSAFGYDDWTEVPGSTTVLHEGLKRGDVDVHMEIWTDNLATYEDDLAAGSLTELSVNFDDNVQGLYVPRYVIEGDPERGIEASAPDLKTVADLKNYKDIFPDEENPGKGRIYGAIPGWEIDTVMYNKYVHYGLDQDFTYFRPGSEAAMVTTLSAAYERGEPIVGYYWEPTWLLGKYDFVLLEDAPYTEEGFLKGETACPSVRVVVGASNQFAEANPEFCEFLKNYTTSSALTSEALAHMQDTGDDVKATAKWFLTEHEDLWTGWMDAEKADAVRAALAA